MTQQIIENPFCCREGCGKIAEFKIGLKFWANARMKARVPNSGAEMFTPLTVCADHKKDVKIADILSPDGREMIVDAFRKNGSARPDFGTTELILMPVKAGNT